MSHPDVIYGYIVESPFRRVTPQSEGVSATYEREIGQAFNDAAIAALPEADTTWPPLIRSMVAIPDRNQVFASFRHHRAISFAVHSNHLFERFAEWLDKFEALLLRRTLWSEATIQYVGEHCCGDHCLEYRAEGGIRWDGQTPRPPESWKFIVRNGRGGLDQNGSLPQWGLFPDLRGRPGYCEPGEFGGVPFR